MMTFWMDRRYLEVHTSLFYYKNPSFTAFSYSEPLNEHVTNAKIEDVKLHNVKISRVLLNKGFTI